MSRERERIVWAIACMVLLGLMLLSFWRYVGPDFLLDFASRLFMC